MSFKSLGGARRNYFTPRWVIRALEAKWGVEFVVDMAACEESRICQRYLDGGPGRDALLLNWGKLGRNHEADKWLFCNPPWHRSGEFVWRCIETEGRCCFLLPARLEPNWCEMLNGYPIDFLTPRIDYWDPLLPGIRTGNGMGSMAVWVWPTWQRQDANVYNRLDISSYKPKNLKQAKILAET